jgi:hypothetical protein
MLHCARSCQSARKVAAPLYSHPTPPAITLGKQSFFQLLYLLQVFHIVIEFYSQGLSSSRICLRHLARPAAAAAAAVLAKAQKSVMCCSQGASTATTILLCIMHVVA